MDLFKIGARIGTSSDIYELFCNKTADRDKEKKDKGNQAQKKKRCHLIKIRLKACLFPFLVPPMKLDEFCEYFGEDFLFLVDAGIVPIRVINIFIDFM